MVVRASKGGLIERVFVVPTYGFLAFLCIAAEPRWQMASAPQLSTLSQI